MKTVTIKISNKELDAMEDATMAWTLCKRHNANTDKDHALTIATCYYCTKMNNTLLHRIFGVWKKLVHEYDKE